MKKTYLPLGSVVLLKGGKKRIMIYGRKQGDIKTHIEYDYVGCLYPEGMINANATFLFNHDDIERIFFLGLQDAEEDAFVQKNLK